MTVEEYFEIVFDTELELKEGKVGEYILEKSIMKTGDAFTIIPDNFQSILLGHTSKQITLQKDYSFYDLFKGNQRIMCNSPYIMYDQYLPYIKAKGKILLGGLGIGIIPKMMCMKSSVEKVTVVELSNEVIQLCGFNNSKLEIINDDFYSFIKKENLYNYDYIYTDAYTSEGDAYRDIIIPIRKYLYQYYPAIPADFWQEDQLKVNYILNTKNLL